MSDIPREFVTLQKGSRLAVPKRIREILEWRIGDQLMVEVYKGKLLVENLSETWRK